MIEAIICLLAIAMVGRIPISKGGSIRTLLAEARKKNLDILVLIDADSQHNPDEIPKLIKPISEGFDFVIDSRQWQSDNIPYYRRIGQRVLSYLSRILSGKGELTRNVESELCPQRP